MNGPSPLDWPAQLTGRATHQGTGLMTKNTSLVTGPEHIYLLGTNALANICAAA